jgi:hypothetical protein
MTVLTAAQNAAAVIGIPKPSKIFGSDEREHFELAALIIEMTERIKKEHDWNKLKSIYSIAGDGIAATYALPSDYQRMLKEGQIWSSLRKGIPLTHIQDSDTWLSDILSLHIPENPQWTVYGEVMHFNPAPVSGEVVSFFYIKKLPDITSDDTVFPISERLLTLGMIWQWKANKGLPYAEDMQTYELELAKVMREDMGADVFAVGVDRYRPNNQFVTLKELTP